MKILPIALALLACGSVLLAQEPTIPAMAAPTAPVVHRTAAGLEELLGPIALYPDALVALILPAATVPTDIVLAARQLRSTRNDLSQIESRAWDDSVKSLTHYPDVLKWMDENLEWTKQVGEAFTVQSADVMNAIQRLRSRARAAGTLTTTPQQQVITRADVIRIVPAQPDIIYVPRYDPGVVFVDRPVFYPLPPLSFGVGFPVGSWLAYDCDWVHRRLWVGDRHRRWHRHDWHRPLVSPHHPGTSVTVRHWQPTHRARPSFQHRGVDLPGPVARLATRPSRRSTPPPPRPSYRSAPPTEHPSHRATLSTVNALPRSNFRSGRELPGPRVHTPVTAPTPDVTTPQLPHHMHRTIRGRENSRSLPNVIADRTLRVAPALPVVAPPLAGSRRIGPAPAHGRTASNLPVAPPLPVVAPPLPATVPTFSESRAPTRPMPGPNVPNAGRRFPRDGGRIHER